MIRTRIVCPASGALYRRLLEVLSRKVIPGQPFPNNVAHRNIKSLTIVKALAVAVTPCLLIQVPEQVEWLDRNVSILQAALQQTPRIFHPIGMDFAANVFNCVVDHFMLELIKDRGPNKSMLTDFGL